ncbi:hypothetical protein GOV10_05175 [Candidatus Woesearchaeota archaeon]|nr:hypothetical protein [Candidatus Woesearchaeota archaeon]
MAVIMQHTNTHDLRNTLVTTQQAMPYVIVLVATKESHNKYVIVHTVE